MADTKYTYSLYSDTTNGVLTNGDLIDEIQASAIVIALKKIDLEGDILDIWFKDTLSAEDQTLLTGIVNSHQGLAEATEVQQVALAEKKSRDGVTQIIPVKSYQDSSKSFTTPDYTNRQSWWFDTQAVTGEILTDSGNGLKFDTTRSEYQPGWGASWINWKKIPNNARQSKPELRVRVYVSGTEVTSGFLVDHALGSVTFDSPPTGPVAVDYHYAKSANFELVPTEGKNLRVDYTEVQFSTGCIMPEDGYIVFAAVYNGPAIPSMGIPANVDVELKRYEYHSGADLLNESTECHVCDPFMELTKKVNVLPWKYLTGHTLKPPGDPTTNLANNEFNKLKCYMVSNATITGEIATGTFYCKVESIL